MRRSPPCHSGAISNLRSKATRKLLKRVTGGSRFTQKRAFGNESQCAGQATTHAAHQLWLTQPAPTYKTWLRSSPDLANLKTDRLLSTHLRLKTVVAETPAVIQDRKVNSTDTFSKYQPSLIWMKSSRIGCNRNTEKIPMACFHILPQRRFSGTLLLNLRPHHLEALSRPRVLHPAHAPD
jgi:hypothetical protein